MNRTLVTFFIYFCRNSGQNSPKMLVLPSTEEDNLEMWHLQSQNPKKRHVYFGNCFEGQKISKVICQFFQKLKETICRTIMYYINKLKVLFEHTLTNSQRNSPGPIMHKYCFTMVAVHVAHYKKQVELFCLPHLFILYLLPKLILLIIMLQHYF